MESLKIKGAPYTVLVDCFCEHYLHEKVNYPRTGLIEKKLKKGDVVTFIKEWSNLYGSYIKVQDSNGVQYDIRPFKLTPPKKVTNK